MSFLEDETTIDAIEREISTEIGHMGRVIDESCLLATVWAIPGDKIIQRYHITTSTPK
jgi:hypothetical protein